MTNFPTDNQELFDKALALVREGLKLTPHEFAQMIVEFVKTNDGGRDGDSD